MSTIMHPNIYNDANGGHTAYLRIPGDTLHVTQRHASEAGAKHAMKVWIAENLGEHRCKFHVVSESQFRGHMAEETVAA